MQHNSAKQYFPSTLISEELSTIIRDVASGKRDPAGFSFTIPADASHVVPCIFCRRPVLTVALASGDELDVETFVTPDSLELRADLTHPHRCAEAERFADFMDAPMREDFDFDSQEEEER